MTDYGFIKLKAQLSVLKDVVREYNGRTINNIISNMEARVKYEEERRKTTDERQYWL